MSYFIIYSYAPGWLFSRKPAISWAVHSLSALTSITGSEPLLVRAATVTCILNAGRSFPSLVPRSNADPRRKNGNELAGRVLVT